MPNNIVFKPTIDVKGIKEVSAPTRIDVPQYPDKGVSYGNFSKNLYSGNTYKLNKQESLDFNSYLTYTGASSGTNFSRTNKDNKDFYCQKIVISGNKVSSLVSSTSTISIGDGSALKLVFMEPSAVNWTLIFDFIVPIKFSKGNNMQVSYSSVRGAGDFLAFNAFGWEED